MYRIEIKMATPLVSVVMAVWCFIPGIVQGQVIDETEIVARQVDRASLDGELAAQGLRVPKLRFKKSDVNLLTRQERDAQALNEVLAYAADHPEDDVEVFVKLEDLPRFAPQVRSMSESERLSAIVARKELLSVSQGRFRDHARALDARTEPLTTVNIVVVSAPGSRIAKILDHEDVVAAAPAWQEVQLDWTLQEYRDQTLVQTFHDNSYWGLSDGQGGRQTIGKRSRG